jgi:predicted alpha/beta-fold hydrolase
VARGHLWTLAPALGHIVRPRRAPPSEQWFASAREDGRVVRVVGRLRQRAETDTAVIVLHGLGGDVGSHYCVRAAQAIDARGWACLRLYLRGADQGSEDFYHAGLTTELRVALAAPELARYRRLFVLGYSLGGHVALHVACTPREARLAAVAAVCPPVDLMRGAEALDRDGCWLYRRHILAGLRASYTRIARRAPVPTPVERVRRVRRIREWDALTVVPRFGFGDVDDYYRRASVGPLLGRLARPTLIVHSEHDPIVPASSVAPSLARLPAHAEAWKIENGGHVGFPVHLERAGCDRAPLETHVLDWLDRAIPQAQLT